MIFGHLVTLALRGLWRHRKTTLINLLALVLGLLAFLNAAGNVALVHNADSLWPHADRIAQLTQQTTPAGSGVPSEVQASISFRAADYLKTDYPALEGVARMRPMGMRPVQHGDRYAFPQIHAVDPDFPRILVWPLSRGDWKTALDRPDSVILGRDIARTLFADTDPLGATVSVHGRNLVVAGVLDEFPAQISQFSPDGIVLVGRETGDFLDYHKEPRAEDWLEPWTQTFVLLPAGLPAAQFEQQLAGFADRHVPREAGTLRFGAVPLEKGVEVAINMGLHAGSTGLSYVVVMLGLGGLVLIVACLNYANLSAAVAMARFREASLRNLLGERRAALLGQGLIEAAILSVCALALLLALILLLAPLVDKLPVLPNWRVLLRQRDFWQFALAGLLIATFSGGLYPSLLMARCRPGDIVRGRRGGRGGRRLSTILVALQFFTASLLMIAGFVVYDQSRSMERLISHDSGDVLLFDPGIPDGRTFTAVHDSLAPLPGVLSISGSTVPWPGQVGATLGRERQGGVRVEAAQESVGPDFFATVGTKLIAGRDFSLDRAADVEPAADKKNSAVTNVVIDRSLAEAMGWSPEAATGQTLFEFGPGWTWELTVAGVTEDRMISLRTDGRRGTIFQFQGNNVWHPLIRVARDHASDTAQAVTAALNALSPTRPVRLEWETTRLIGAAAGLHAEAMFFGGLTLFALFIAIIGLAGMAFHATGRRMREIGIRKTLGASSALILRLLLIDFSRPVVLAVLMSWPIAFLAAQGYLSLFTQRTTVSAFPFLGSLALCLGMGALAVGAQTLRAARGNPADILRDE